MDQTKSLHEAYLGPSPVLSLDVIWTHGVAWGGTLGESWGESWGGSWGGLSSILNRAHHR